MSDTPQALEQRLARLEELLAGIARDVAAISAASPSAMTPGLADAIADAHTAMAQHPASLDAHEEAARAWRDADRWRAYAKTLDR